jgi:hypothetical protein
MRCNAVLWDNLSESATIHAKCLSFSCESSLAHSLPLQDPHLEIDRGTKFGIFLSPPHTLTLGRCHCQVSQQQIKKNKRKGRWVEWSENTYMESRAIIKIVPTTATTSSSTTIQRIGIFLPPPHTLTWGHCQNVATSIENKETKSMLS